MSVHITSLVWKAEIQMSHKIVLLKLADHAKDDGSDVFPSQKHVAAECGCSDRHVRSVQDWAIGAGILVPVAQSRGRVNAFRFDIEALRTLSNRNHVPVEDTEERNDIPVQEEKWNDVPVGEGEKRNHVPVSENQPRKDIPVPRNHVPVVRNHVPGGRNHVPTNHHITTKESPSNPRGDFLEILSEQVLEILRQVPGVARATGPGQLKAICEIITGNSWLEPDDWLEAARGCRDWCSEWKKMGPGSTTATSAPAILRKYLDEVLKPRRQAEPTKPPSSPASGEIDPRSYRAS